ncbi:hypothetical protein Cgig2_024893 [Carnegiea gigantea]|uniref:Transposase-associated domain-containing protein n=1 Tax=Carnegiea gigantea TaxID=171969 RepID=A0A9Q1QGP6_9CARY|nr:hypothetical protein Cgig2_024893 [Carnegiea gigantea]
MVQKYWNVSWHAYLAKLKPTRSRRLKQEMDSSWIELPNDHPDYLDGAIKFIKLAKENLVEGRTRCPCRRCKVDKWLPMEEVEQHILFKGFHKEYKHFIFHGKEGILDHIKYGGSTSREINIDPPNFTSGDDMEGLLRAAFEVDMPRCIEYKVKRKG